MAILQKNRRKYIDVKADLIKLYKMNKHGNKMLVSDFDNLINNHLPAKPSCLDCRDQNTARLQYAGRFRDDGLKNGFYFGKDGKYFVTYKITENLRFIKNYAHKARNAANRGMDLNDSTPAKHNPHKINNSNHFKNAIDALNKVA